MVDLFATPISSARISDVRQGSTVPLSGNMVIKVPDTISVQNPSDVTDLVTKKHLGILALYAGYPNIVYDDLLDATDVDTGATNVAGLFGDRNVISVLPGACFQSTTVVLGSAPSSAVVTWETYSQSMSDVKDERAQPSYIEESSASAGFVCDVSFDNGATFTTAFDGITVNIPLISQGTNFILRLTNLSSGPTRDLRVGSWALVF